MHNWTVLSACLPAPCVLTAPCSREPEHLAELILSTLWSVCSAEFNTIRVFPNFLVKVTPIQQTTTVTLMGRREHGAGKSVRFAGTGGCWYWADWENRDSASLLFRKWLSYISGILSWCRCFSVSRGLEEGYKSFVSGHLSLCGPDLYFFPNPGLTWLKVWGAGSVWQLACCDTKHCVAVVVAVSGFW